MAPLLRRERLASARPPPTSDTCPLNGGEALR